MKTLTKPQPLPTWETDLEIERTMYAEPSNPINPPLIVAIMDAFILGILLVCYPSYAPYFGWLAVGAALTAIVVIVITNFKHIKEELK